MVGVGRLSRKQGSGSSLSGTRDMGSGFQDAPPCGVSTQSGASGSVLQREEHFQGPVVRSAGGSGTLTSWGCDAHGLCTPAVACLPGASPSAPQRWAGPPCGHSAPIPGTGCVLHTCISRIQSRRRAEPGLCAGDGKSSLLDPRLRRTGSERWVLALPAALVGRGHHFPVVWAGRCPPEFTSTPTSECDLIWCKGLCRAS